jgi:Pyruvate/2-oxoacid:ferredoxin oxidoreductase gamma subunit
MLGALVGSGALPVGLEVFEPELRESLPPGKLDLNLKAFRKGIHEVSAAGEPV